MCCTSEGISHLRQMAIGTPVVQFSDEPRIRYGCGTKCQRNTLVGAEEPWEHRGGNSTSTLGERDSEAGSTRILNSGVERGYQWQHPWPFTFRKRSIDSNLKPTRVAEIHERVE